MQVLGDTTSPIYSPRWAVNCHVLVFRAASLMHQSAGQDFHHSFFFSLFTLYSHREICSWFGWSLKSGWRWHVDSGTFSLFTLWDTFGAHSETGSQVYLLRERVGLWALPTGCCLWETDLKCLSFLLFKVSGSPKEDRGSPRLAERTTAADRGQSSHPATSYRWGATGMKHSKP